MPDAPILTERRDGALIMRLNRPEKLNAITQEMATLLGDALEALEREPDLRVGVITGTGRAFSAGADLGSRFRNERPVAQDHEHWGFAGLSRHAVSKPLIAAVNGLAHGGGAEIAFCCDLIVAAPSAEFALPEVKRGLIAGGGGLVHLPSMVSRPRAMQLALTGDPISAQTALEWGLINEVSDGPLEAALDLARRIAANAPLAIASSRRVLRRIQPDEPEAQDAWLINDAESKIRDSADAAEGARAFLEHRRPVWRGV